MDGELEAILAAYDSERGEVPPYVELLAEMKPDVLKDWVRLRTRIYEDGAFPRKHKELIVMAMCLSRLYARGAEVHMRVALEHGATREEVLEVLLLAIPGTGIPAFSSGVSALASVEAGRSPYEDTRRSQRNAMDKRGPREA